MVKKALCAWSKLTYGDVFKKITTMDDVIKMKELQLEFDPSEKNRANLRKAVAELGIFQKYEEGYWKQKAGMYWFKEGDRNTKLVYAYVKGRREKTSYTENRRQTGKRVGD